MCGRYTVLTEDEIIEIREILKDLSLRIVRDDFEDYDEAPGEVLPTNHAPVITKNNDGIAFESVKWGFKKWNSPGVIINARSETMRTKSTFAKHLETGRCVVPAGEFFEWEKLETGKKKHYAKDRAGNLLFMAGLYRDVKDDKNPDETIREFVIITKAATGEMAKIHDRMPVILRVEQIEPWLTGVMTPEDIEKMEFDITVNPCDDENTKQISLF
ncbi:MAG: SOS response-associated peptidase [Eubacteriales bacterium]|nr:SOS response-associated peptidase [Eubacteriales bacterium]